MLLGGPSSEREVSLMSGNGVLGALREGGVDAHPFDPAQRDLHELKRDGFDRVFIALHGRFGEDGTVQGALETLRIPYTGSGVMASALAMDKWRTKLVWLASGVPTPRYRKVDAQTDWMRIVAELGLPLIVKPAREGSTIGITKVSRVDHDEMALAYTEASRHDPLVLVEEFVRRCRTDGGNRQWSRAAVDSHRGPARQLRLSQQILLRRNEIFLSGRPARRQGSRRFARRRSPRST